MTEACSPSILAQATSPAANTSGAPTTRINSSTMRRPKRSRLPKNLSVSGLARMPPHRHRRRINCFGGIQHDAIGLETALSDSLLPRNVSFLTQLFPMIDGHRRPFNTKAMSGGAATTNSKRWTCRSPRRTCQTPTLWTSATMLTGSEASLSKCSRVWAIP
jgi:hypothetical protein